MSRQSSVSRVVVLGVMVLVAFATTGAARDCPEIAGLMPGDVSVVEVSGELAYFGSGSSLLIADVSDPTKPKVLGSIVLPDTVIAISISGDFAYVATVENRWGVGWLSAIHVIDATVPSTPAEVRSFEGAHAPVHDTAIADGYLYVVAGDSLPGGPRIKGSLQVIDVRNPLSPRTVAFLEAVWWMPEGVAVANGYAYVTFSDLGLRVFDVSSPSAPVQVGTHAMPHGARSIAVSEDYLYVVQAGGSSGELCVMDVSTPSSPVELGLVETSGDAHGIEVAGGYAYIPEGEAGVRVVDVRIPSAPVQAGFIDTPGEGFGVAVSDDRAFIADGREGLRVVDVSEPSAPVAAGRVDAIVARGVAAADSFAYVANSDGFAVIDMSTPSEPVKVGFLELDVRSVAVSESLAYALGNDRLHIIDVSEPYAPVEVGFLALSGWSVAVANSESYAYIFGGGLRVIDASVPSAPVEVGFFGDFSGDCGGVVDGYAYLFGYGPLGDGLYVIDVSTPSAPVEVGYLETFTSEIDAVEVSDGFVYRRYSGCWPGSPKHCWLGLHVTDVSDPTAPVKAGWLAWSWVPPPYPTTASLSVSGGFVFLGDAGVLHIIDVSTPSAPVEVRSLLTTPGEPLDFAKSGNYTYAALGDAGMYMLDTRGCRRPYQNPDQPSAEVE